MQLHYFAFGSNLSSARLLQRIPRASIHGIARLEQHQLRWHKRGSDRSGKCDMVHSADPEHCVYGVVYRMTADEMLILDGHEGEGVGYRRAEIVVTALHGGSIDAFTYFALQTDELLQPYHWYKAHVLRGAEEHGLPADYVDAIRATASIDDLDRERHRREMSIHPAGRRAPD